MLVTRNGLPLYYQVENYIRNKILSGEWEVGQQIPTETQLIESFGVSRAPLRQAISNLCIEGFLNRVQGKGTFVMEHSGFGNDPTEIWEHPVEGVSHHPISIVTRAALKCERKRLNIDSQEPLTVISYVHYVKQCVKQCADIPYNLSISYFPQSSFPNIDQYFYSDSVYSIATKIYNLSLAYTFSEFHIVNLNEEQSGYLELEPNTATIKVEKVYYSNDGLPLFYTDVFMHPRNSTIQIKTPLR